MSIRTSLLTLMLAVSLSLLLIICGFASLLLLSPAVGKYTLNHVLAQYDAHLDCLDYQYQWPDKLLISRACVQAPSLQVQMHRADYAVSAKTLEIDDIQVHLLEDEAPDHVEEKSASPSNFSLPTPPVFLSSLIANMSVDSFRLTHPALPETIAFDISQPDTHTLTLKRGWQLNLTYINHSLNGDFKASFADIMPYLPEVALVYLQAIESSEIFSFDFSLNQHNLTAHLSLPRSFSVPLTISNTPCELHYNYSGQYSINADLNDFSASVGFDQQPIKLTKLSGEEIANAENCVLPKPMQVLNIPESLLITVPEPIRYTDGQFTLAELHINSEQVLPEQTQTVALSAQDMQFIPGQQASAKLYVLALPYQQLEVTSHLDIAWSPDSFAITSDVLTFTAEQLSYADNIAFKALSGQASVGFTHESGLTIDGKINIADAALSEVIAQNIAANLKLTHHINSGWQGSTTITGESLRQRDMIELTGVQQTLNFNQQALESIQFDGLTKVQYVSANGIAIGALDIQHTGKLAADLSPRSLSGQHQISALNGLSAKATSSIQRVEVNIPSQSILALSSLVSSVVPDAQLSDGDMAGGFYYELEQGQLSGQMAINSLALNYGEYLLTNLNTELPIQYDSGGLQLPPSNLDIDSIDVGIQVSDIQTQLSAQNNVISMTDIRANLLDGNLHLDKLVLSPEAQTSLASIRDIDLNSVMSVQQEAGIQSGGIQLSGSIEGDIPIHLQNWQATIVDASLTNSGIGTLKINNNAAFASLKQQQPQIGAQLAMLEHLEFDQLIGRLNLHSDGQAFFDLQLKGVNPEHQQPIAFNYTHDQNLFLLLKSLRLAEQISNKVERKLSDSGEG